MYAIRSPYPEYVDNNGNLLDNGNLYFGVANTNPVTNPTVVYWDMAGTIAAEQPIKTLNGLAYRDGSPSDIFTQSDYSLSVYDKNNVLIFYKPSAVENTGQYLPTINVKDAAFGAQGNGTTDDTASIQLAINTVQNLVGTNNSGGGSIYFPPGTYLITGTLNIMSSFITLYGDGIQSTYLNFNNGTQDCIHISGTSINSIRDCVVRDMSINGSNKTGGNNLYVNYTYRCSFERLALEYCANGIYVGVTNDTTLRDITVVMLQDVGANGIQWTCKNDGTERADVLAMFNVTVEGNWCNGVCLSWSGWCNTLVGSSIRLLHANYGMRIFNPTLSASYFPSFANLHDLEIEGAKAYALSIEAGVGFKFSCADISNLSGGSTLQGNADANAVVITPDTGGSFTRSVHFVNSRFGSCRGSGMLIQGRDVMLSNCIFFSTSFNNLNVNHAIVVDSTALDVVINNIICEEYGGAAQAAHGVFIVNGAANVMISNINGNFLNSNTVQNNSTSPNISVLNTIEPSGNRSGLFSVGSNTEMDYVQNVIGGSSTFKVVNESNDGSAIASYGLATGGANIYSLLGLHNNSGNPYLAFSLGSAVNFYSFLVKDGTIGFDVGRLLAAYANDAAAATGGIAIGSYYHSTTVNATVQRRS